MAKKLKHCPHCSKVIAARAMTCIHCGYDLKTGVMHPVEPPTSFWWTVAKFYRVNVDKYPSHTIGDAIVVIGIMEAIVYALVDSVIRALRRVTPPQK